jgi:hypothetical protein
VLWCSLIVDEGGRMLELAVATELVDGFEAKL